jgi:deoxyadenosine/deoxycytidine kinase
MQSVVIFGAPGAGKSTQVQLIRKLMPEDASVRVACEPTDSIEARALVADLYKGVAGAAFKLQSLVLAERVQQYESRATEIVLADGHPLTDLGMYVRPAIESGGITPSESGQYMIDMFAHAGRVPAAFAPPTCVIFLRVDPAEVARRVEARNSSAEKGVDAKVFEQLALRATSIARELHEKHHIEVIEVDGHGDKTVVAQRVFDRLEKHFRRINEERASPFAKKN